MTPEEVLQRDIEIYKYALKIAIELINGLVDQQGVEDDWYWTDLAYIRVLAGDSPSEILADYRQARIERQAGADLS